MAWLGRPQIGDCINVAASQVCRFRGPRYRWFPARAVRAGHPAPGHARQPGPQAPL